MQKLLLQVCCGPCVAGIFTELQEQYDLTVYFYNPNIHPQEEYKKRREEVVKLCEELSINFIEGEYNTEDWFAWAREYAEEREGGERCSKCFAMRLEQTAKFAKENNFDIFASTLTSGRNKPADVINPLGESLGEKYGVEFLAEDWKKKGRQEKGLQVCKAKDIYRQHYCGCIYSLPKT